MDNEQQKDCLDRTIDAITRQIEILSKKCILEENRNDKNYSFEKLIEASSIMLQLSRTLNELLVTQKLLKNSNGSDDIDTMMKTLLGGRKN